MPSAPKHSERPFWPDGTRLRLAIVATALAGFPALAGIAAVTGLFTDPGQAPADPPVAAKATASTAAAKPEVVSALTLPRPAHDITVSKDGRILMMMVDAPALVEWVNGELRAYPDAGWNDAKAPTTATRWCGRVRCGSGRTGCCGCWTRASPAWTTAGPSSSPSTWRPTRWCAAIRSTPAL